MKNKLRKFIYYFLQFTWGFFQNLIGLFIFLFLFIINPHRRIEKYHYSIVSYWNFSSSCGCGIFIFLGHHNKQNYNDLLSHEYGHNIQSVFLGPLFLPIIALPSMIWAFTPLFKKWRREKRYRYGDFYPEKWADNLGKRVTRPTQFRR